MALTARQRQALISAEQATRKRITDATVEALTQQWRNMGSWRDEDVARFVAQASPQLLASENAVARLTAAFIAQMTDTKPVGTVDMSELRGGVTEDEILRRPAVEMRTKLASGATFDAAQSAAIARLSDLVKTNLQLANTHQSRASMEPSGVKMFRRTLTGHENCALCAIASTQRYWKGDLMPIHPGCDCGVEPYNGPNEWVIDDDLLESIHSAVEAKFGWTDRGARDLGIGKRVVYSGNDERLADYTELMVVRQHGEYGPTLTWRSDHFTGPRDI